MTPIEFTVYGRPQQRGSKRASLIPKSGGGFLEKGGRPVVAARDMNPRSKEWMSLVRDAAPEFEEEELLDGPLSLSVTFYFGRPKSHFGTGRNSNRLKGSAPQFHAQTPDLAKLVRCLEDALTGQVWRDDRQVCQYGDIRKAWTTKRERAEVRISQAVEKRLPTWEQLEAMRDGIFIQCEFPNDVKWALRVIDGYIDWPDKEVFADA